jgi:hypothetical protein
MTRIHYRWLLIAGSLALVFAVAAAKFGTFVAAISILCFVTGYLNEFYLLRPAVHFFFRERTLSKAALGAGMLALVGDAILVQQGFAFVLGVVTLGYFWMDAIALRFE